MKKTALISFFLLVCLCTIAPMAAPRPAQAGVVKNAVLYVPNRVFDLLDIVRLRVRVGPGISAGVRATRPLSAYLGFHSSVFVGLPGPRGRQKIPWPVGYDLRSGAQASIADASTGTPYYDPLEVGLEVQPIILGVNAGIGVFEILDFFTGFVFIDLQGDDFGRAPEQETAPEPAAVSEG